MAHASCASDHRAVMGNRGIVSSLGAGLSLVVAGACMLAVFTAVLAFRGFPEMRADRPAADVRIARVNAPKPVARPVVVGAGGRAQAVGARPGAVLVDAGTDGSPGRSGGRRGARSAPPAVDARRQNARTRPAGSGSTAPAITATPQTVPLARKPAPRADPVGRATEGAQRIVDDVVGPKPAGSPPVSVPQVLEHTRETVDSVTDDAGRVASGALAGR